MATRVPSYFLTSTKQRLLEAENVPAMLARENALLMREIQFLQSNIGAEFVLDSQQISFSAS